MAAAGAASPATVAVLVSEGAAVGGALVGVPVAVTTGAAVAVVVPVAGGDVAVAGAWVGVAVAVGTGGQVGFGVGFHWGPGVGVLPASGGESTSGANPMLPCTTTATSATQPSVPSRS